MTPTKVGVIAPAFREKGWGKKFIGPVFKESLFMVSADEIFDVPMIAGGFMAFETELAFCMNRDFPERDRPYHWEEIAEAVAEVRINLEIVKSPVADIPAFGPGAIISEQGVNGGLVLGACVSPERWKTLPDNPLRVNAKVDDAFVTGGSEAVLDGAFDSVMFAIATLNRLGEGIRKGDWISSGAMTGLHRVGLQSVAMIDFEGIGTIRARFVEGNKAF